LRILIVSHLWPRTDWQHLGVFVSEQVAALKKRCDVTVVVPVDRTIRRDELTIKEIFAGLPGHKRRINPDLLPVEDIVPLALPFRSKPLRNQFAAAAAINLSNSLQQLQEYKFDIVHAHTVFPDGLACALWLQDRPVPLVVTGHGSDVHSASSGVRNALKPLFKRADALVPVSTFLGECLIDYGADRERIHPIPNGFTAEQFRGVDDSNRKAGRVVFLGRLDDVKRVDLLIRALSHCPENITLEIAGDGAKRREYEALAKRFGLERRVHFCGRIMREQIPGFLASASLMCLVSRKEGWPTVIFESLACGTPVLATAVGGIPEAIEDDRLGRTVSADISAEDLSTEIQSALGKEWDRQYMIEYAFQNSWDEITGRLMTLHSDLITARSNHTDALI